MPNDPLGGATPTTTPQWAGDAYTYQAPDPFVATQYQFNPQTDIANYQAPAPTFSQPLNMMAQSVPAAMPTAVGTSQRGVMPTPGAYQAPQQLTTQLTRQNLPPGAQGGFAAAPSIGAISDFAAPSTAYFDTPGAAALTGLMDAPGTSTMDLSTATADLTRAMTGSPMSRAEGLLDYSNMLPIMQPMMRGLEQDQMRQRDQLNQALIARGMGNSTIGDQARQQQATKQAADKAALVANTYSQLIPTQTNALMSLQAGERAQRAQDVGELLSGISTQEQAMQGALSRGLQQRQQGQAEQAQRFGQEMGLRQQDVGELLSGLQTDEALRQGAFGRQIGARGLAEQEQAGLFGRQMQQRQQGVSDLMQAIQQQEAMRQGALGRGLAGRQQGASEAAQGFAQQLQREQQDMSNYFQFYNAQQQMDQVQRAQQMQALALMLNALGQQTITPQYPTGQIQPPAPGAGSAIGGLLGNIGTAIAGTDRFGSWLFGDG